jgi:CRISPR-associated protein Cmr6
MKYPIPKRSAQAYQNLRDRATNPGLIFDRFAPDWGNAPGKEASEWKKEGLKAAIRHKADGALIAAYLPRWKELARHSHAVPFPMKTDWRLIAGLGGKGPLEVGFTFHRYGFPILPGSSVKGIARSWSLYQIQESTCTEDVNCLEKILVKAQDEEFKEAFTREYGDTHLQAAVNFREVFGTTESAGWAIFFDSVPSRSPKLELDVMNPHFPDYYSGKEKYPTNWQSPVPVFFLTVAQGEEFNFAVGWRNRQDHLLRVQAEKWLREGLRYLGAGAKTSAGYGFFGP